MKWLIFLFLFVACEDQPPSTPDPSKSSPVPVYESTPIDVSVLAYVCKEATYPSKEECEKNCNSKCSFFGIHFESSPVPPYYECEGEENIYYFNKGGCEALCPRSCVVFTSDD